MSKELIDRAEVLEILFPLGIPPAWKSDDWDYCVSARAIYNALMKCEVFEHEEVLGTPVETVDLPDFALRAFCAAGKKTVEEVLAMNYRWLLSLKRIGPKKAEEVIAALEKQGYDCTKLKTKDNWRMENLLEIKERGYAPKIVERTDK